MNLLFSLNFSLSFSRNVFFFKNIIFVFALSYFFKKKKNFNLIFNIYLIIIIIVSLDILLEFFTKKNILGFQSYDPTRIASFLDDKLKIGHFLLGFSFITAGHYFEKYSKKSMNYKVFGYFLILIFFISLLLTGERANLLKGTFIIFMFIMLSNNKIIKYKKIFLSSIILLLCITFFFSERIKYRFNVIFQPLKDIGVFKTFEETQHAAHYYTALRIFEKYPFFGIGNKNFREECLNQEYENKNLKRGAERCSTHPHQIYFELLSEHGIVGTITIIFIMSFFLLKNFKIYLKNKNAIHLASILFIFSQFLPLIPSGSFFTSWSSKIFWINFSVLIYYNNKFIQKRI